MAAGDRKDGLTHFDAGGRARMVDVSGKQATARTAIASCRVVMAPATLDRLQAGEAAKGDVLGVARLAGIMGAKRTSDLIPLCHPLPLSTVAIDLMPDDAMPGVRIEALCKTTGRTGVEMEALTAAGVAALTVYDMLKAIDRAMVITDLRLEAKEGGKSGTYRREAE
jgi:cyclic pyranopterin phosphate synthase